MRTGSGIETDLPSLSHPEPLIWQSLEIKVQNARHIQYQKVGDKSELQAKSPNSQVPHHLPMPSSPLTLKKTQTHQTEDSERGVPHHRGLRPSQQHSPRALTGGSCELLRGHQFSRKEVKAIRVGPRRR